MRKKLNKRNTQLDIARIIAILAVVMIHSSANFLVFYKINSREFFWGNIFDSIARIGVPIFIMISGALFLNEQKAFSLKDFMNKYVKKMVIITLIWATIYSVLYQIIFPIIFKQPIIIKNVIYAIIFGHNHMWYLYMIIGLYIITPFLKKIVNKENKNMVLLFIAISLLTQFSVPIINMINKLGLDVTFINTWIQSFHLNFFGGFITYYLTGWYINNIGISKKIHKYIIYSLGIISLISMILYIKFTGDYENPYQNINILVYLYSVSVFLALNNKKLKLKEKTTSILAKISKLTFGVYIIHEAVLRVFNIIIPYGNYPIIYIILSFIVVTISSFIISFAISKIPVIKKIIKT